MSNTESAPGRSRSTWTPERVVREIQLRHRNGLPVNAQTLHRDDSRLLAAGRRHFGSWKAALTAAQVPVPSRRHHDRHPRGHWTRERLIHAIVSHAWEGDPLHAHGLQKLNNRLVSAATYHFGSWGEALRQAGLDADAIRATPKYTRASLLEEIRTLVDGGEDTRDVSMRRHHRSTYSAAQKYFGSWRNALQLLEEMEEDDIEQTS
jgi:hypothetical protein